MHWLAISKRIFSPSGHHSLLSMANSFKANFVSFNTLFCILPDSNPEPWRLGLPVVLATEPTFQKLDLLSRIFVSNLDWMEHSHRETQKCFLSKLNSNFLMGFDFRQIKKWLSAIFFQLTNDRNNFSIGKLKQLCNISNCDKDGDSWCYVIFCTVVVYSKNRAGTNITLK